MRILTTLTQFNRLKSKLNIYPIINIFDKQTMLSWLDMRIICQDLALRFFYRIQLYTSVYILVYTFWAIIYLAYFFGTHITVFSQEEWYPIVFEILNFMFMIASVIILGIKINSETEVQIYRMTELKNLIFRLIADWDLLFDPSQTEESHQLQNNAHTLAYKYFKVVLQTKSHQECKEELRETMKALDQVKERLEKEHQFNPIKILGIPLIPSVAVTLVTAIFSISIAIVNKKTQIFF